MKSSLAGTVSLVNRDNRLPHIKSRAHPLFVGVPNYRDPRLAFATLLTLFAILGTAWLGFNRTPAQIVFTVSVGCALDMALHFVLRERRLLVPLSAYISSLSIALLLNYAHDWLLVLLPVFATVGPSFFLFAFFMMPDPESSSRWMVGSSRWWTIA
jgi:Na+-translocating ferredoxin:NAD+ oxidoreductase RnfD subunit